MIPAKLATLDLLRIKVFWSKGYDVKISVHEVTNKILSCDPNYIIDMVMWPKFGNKFVQIWPEKPILLKGAGSSSMTWDWH